MNSWNRVLEKIEKRINRHSFRTWFQPTKQIEDKGGELTIGVPNPLFQEWINSNYLKVVNESAAEVKPPVKSVSFVCPNGGNGVRPRRRARSAPAGSRTTPAEIPLNPRYTFDSFVVSSCNEFAHAAALAVADKPSNSYNPLYVYGGVGLGKTHLMHAIGNHLVANGSRTRLCYVTTENFMNELINCIRFEKTIEFKEKYRNVDVLLMDDIQFLEGKERTQEEFFHTFNQLYELQKQIVITSDCPPREISALEERLRSRFEWGLIADIQPPDLETKVAILRKKAEMESITLPQEVSLYVASKVKSNIRELEGCLVRLVAYSSLLGRPIDLEMATETLKDIISETRHAVTIESIQKLVADSYGVKVSHLRSKNNAKMVALPRHVAMYLSKELTGSSLPEIGRRFGGKHHSTVLHAVRKIDRKRKEDADFDKQIQGLIELLQ